LNKGTVLKHHWLYGDLWFNVDVQKEDDCGKCTHWCICKRTMENFCLNYCFGTSEKTPCNGCLHRHTRLIWHEKDGVACFKCKHYKELELNPSQR